MLQPRLRPCLMWPLCLTSHTVQFFLLKVTLFNFRNNIYFRKLEADKSLLIVCYIILDILLPFIFMKPFSPIVFFFFVFLFLSLFGKLPSFTYPLNSGILRCSVLGFIFFLTLHLLFGSFHDGLFKRS